MALLTTPTCEFGKKIINFSLLNIDNEFYETNQIIGSRGTLIMFLCNHCPYVKAIIKKLSFTTDKLKELGVNSVAIMPNDVNNYPEDSFENMKIFAKNNNLNFPYLFDENQVVAREFGAVCTPDFFGYNKNGDLQYRGRIGELKNLEFSNDKNELLEGMTLVSKKQEGPQTQFPSAGCSIKWK